MPRPQVITGSVPALERALADAVRTAKSGDPLTCVTVLVGGTLMRPTSSAAFRRFSTATQRPDYQKD